MTIDLIIAEIRIRLFFDGNTALSIDERFSAFISGTGGEPCLTIDVKAGNTDIPAGAVKVFDAHLMEETPDGVRNSGEPFWEALVKEGITYVNVFLKDPVRTATLVIPDGEMKWKVFTGSDNGPVNPLPYPLDGLMLYFLTSARGEIMIHGSGVVCNNRGWIFTGRSGSGKTTIASIFDRAGDRVIHDDRLVLRKEGQTWRMYNTPVYRNDEPRSADISHLWGITHGRSNVSVPVSGAEAAGMVLSNCIQQNWDKNAAARLAGAVDDLAGSVMVSRLSFLPDSSIRDYLMLRCDDDKMLTADAVTMMLAEKRAVTVTAGGYSMWPAIKPGDKIVIEPPDDYIPASGDIVALKRDGGYVVHRIIKVISGEDCMFFITQGDAVMKPDDQAGESEIAGIVKKIVRKGNEIVPPGRRFPVWINRVGSFVVSCLKN